jgi:hypothetical protein
MELSYVRMFIRANYMSWGIYYSVSVRNKYAAFDSVAMVTDMGNVVGPTDCTKSLIVSLVLIHLQPRKKISAHVCTVLW